MALYRAWQIDAECHVFFDECATSFELLNESLLLDLDRAPVADYDTRRPHSSLGCTAPLAMPIIAPQLAVAPRYTTPRRYPVVTLR
jgi:hypothetical protein